MPSSVEVVSNRAAPRRHRWGLARPRASHRTATRRQNAHNKTRLYERCASSGACVVEHLRKHDVVPKSGEAVVETPHVSPTVVGRAVFFVVVMLGVGVCLVARRRRAAREASNSVQQLEALKELSLKLNPQSSNPEL